MQENTSNKIHLCEHSLCTGCMACVQKCSFEAISIETLNGFAYPSINNEKCKKCGLCMDACPILNTKGTKGNKHEHTQLCYAAWNKSINIREKSSSGGVFTAFAEHIISSGGVVFGAAWDSHMVLKHKAVETSSELEFIRKSKYVQSDVGNTFNQVEKELKKNRLVLYCGTHCQIAGLNSFLGKRYEKLYLVDILCQGVPSPLLLEKYFNEIEKKYKSKVCNCNFRNKEKAWRCGFSLDISLEDGRKIKKFLNHNEYYNAFYNEFFMRESCYRCRFKICDLGFYSDITLADFWRIGEKFPLIDDCHLEKGVSAVIVNTQHGQKLIDDCRNKISLVERPWQEFSTNGGLNISQKPLCNSVANEYLNNHSWHETQQKFFPIGKKRFFYDILLLIFGEKCIRKFKLKLNKALK